MRRFFLFSLLLALLSSCANFEGSTDVLNFNVALRLPNEFHDNAVLAQQKVTLSNATRSYSVTTDAQGVARFLGVIPDLYNLSCAWEVSGDSYQRATDSTAIADRYVLAGNVSSLLLDGSSERLELPVLAAAQQALIISKIYASGSKDANNRNYSAGKYIELFNNSDAPLSLDGYCIGLIESNSPTPAYALGATPQYLYLKQLFRFPESAHFVLQPGKAVLVVNSAVNHLANNAPKEADLSGADFEAKDVSGRTVNNSATPAIELLWTMWQNVSIMNLVQGGPTSVVIFKSSDQEIAQFEKVYANGKTSGNLYLRIPKKIVRDGVDIVKYNPTSGVDFTSRRLYNDIDAGYTHISNSSGQNGEVLCRLRASDNTATGAIIKLRDSNNSTSDFVIATSNKPREY